ncbi:methyltransferase-like protein 27 isoform X2 [Tachyglossus aculeatus]|uniref:methyltransferase-like protein 27 isoform X2 n=1 Tax=Tachyglossus aculeatus TaxID=9261 RepID=UPI0018F53C83|nr:methyltransferase-like protein 27 isoform X2 [Tachyglossus aculeatus]
MATHRRSLEEVCDLIGGSHSIRDLSQKLQFYDQWAPRYDQDVDVLEYRAPRLAVGHLAAAWSSPPEEALILDVACGTGLVAAELRRHGFCQIHGMDGSAGMLERARQQGLYRWLGLCTLGQESLPVPSDQYDAVTIVGALSEGQVPCSALPELLRVTKPGPTPPTCATRRIWKKPWRPWSGPGGGSGCWSSPWSGGKGPPPPRKSSPAPQARAEEATASSPA